MSRSSTIRRATSAIVLAGLIACDHKTPTAPSNQTTAYPAIGIASVSVAAERRTIGYAYRTIIQLHESGGVAATILAADLVFSSGTAAIVSSHYDQPIADGTSVCPASGTVSTRELLTVDVDAAHPVATTVQAKITFSDGAAYTSSALGSADVPPLPTPPPQTFTLTGVITDAASHAAIDGAQLEVLGGLNAGKSAATDRSGTYVLRDLSADTFRLRASADDYQSGEQNVTVPANPSADFELRHVAVPCAYTVDPPGPLHVTHLAGQSSLTLTRTSGACGWQATTDAYWISMEPTGGTGSATLTVHWIAWAAPIPNIRQGSVIIQWAGGRSEVVFEQSGELPDFCSASVTVDGRDTIYVPAAGGEYTARLQPLAGQCYHWSASADPGITINGATSGTPPASIPFVVHPLPTGTNGRRLLLTVTVLAPVGPTNLTLTVVQSTP